MQLPNFATYDELWFARSECALVRPIEWVRTPVGFLRGATDWHSQIGEVNMPEDILLSGAVQPVDGLVGRTWHNQTRLLARAAFRSALMTMEQLVSARPWLEAQRKRFIRRCLAAGGENMIFYLVKSAPASKPKTLNAIVPTSAGSNACSARKPHQSYRSIDVWLTTMSCHWWSTSCFPTKADTALALADREAPHTRHRRQPPPALRSGRAENGATR